MSEDRLVFDAEGVKKHFRQMNDDWIRRKERQAIGKWLEKHTTYSSLDKVIIEFNPSEYPYYWGKKLWSR